MKNWLFLSIFASALVLFDTPAHARGFGIIGDLWTLGENVINGTIPLPYVLAFVALIVAIGVLGTIEARKNARKAAEAEATSTSASTIDLTK